MKNLTLRHVEALVTLLDEPNLVRAAARLKMSQSTLTRLLQSAEDGSGNTLFEYRGRQKVMTEFARSLAVELKRSLHEVQTSIHKVSQDYSGKNRVRLKIGARIEILDRIFSNLEYKGLIEFFPMSSPQVTEKLVSQSLDLGISDQKMEGLQWISRKIFEDQNVLMVPKNWMHNHTQAESWLKIYSTKYPGASYTEDYTISSDFRLPNPSLIVNDWRMIVARLKNGLNWAVAPSSFIRQDNQEIQELPFRKTLKKAFYLHYRTELRKKDWFHDFLESLPKIC